MVIKSIMLVTLSFLVLYAHSVGAQVSLDCESLITSYQQAPSPTEAFRYQLRGNVNGDDLRCEGLVVQNTTTARPQIQIFGVDTEQLRNLTEDSEELWFTIYGSQESEAVQLSVLSRKKNYRLDYIVEGGSSVRWPIEETRKQISTDLDDIQAVAWKNVKNKHIYLPIVTSDKSIGASNDRTRVDEFDFRYDGFAKKIDAYFGRYIGEMECTDFDPNRNRQWLNITPSQVLSFTINDEFDDQFCTYFIITIIRENRTVVDEQLIYFSK